MGWQRGPTLSAWSVQRMAFTQNPWQRIPFGLPGNRQAKNPLHTIYIHVWEPSLDAGTGVLLIIWKPNRRLIPFHRTPRQFKVTILTYPHKNIQILMGCDKVLIRMIQYKYIAAIVPSGNQIYSSLWRMTPWKHCRSLPLKNGGLQAKP